jgi:hypothetical protein
MSYTLYPYDPSLRRRVGDDGNFVVEKDPNYFDPPHGGRPPSDEAVHAATQRYIDKAKKKK